MFGLSLFRSADPDPLPALSIIGDDTTIHGDTIEGTGDLRIEGTIHADIVREGRVVVAPDGAVHGTVRAESIHVAGTARGELHAADTLVLGASSDVQARLQADALTIESGADFKGVVHGEADESLGAIFPSGDHLPAPAGPVGDEGEADDGEEFVPVWDAE
jgi:cytoskeletal protein CcmA (bactofilin family)